MDTIEKKIVLKAPQARIWRAISDATEFGSWFGVKFDGQFEEGTLLRGVITPTTVDEEVAKKQKQYEGASFEITVERIEPERLFSFRWHPFATDPTVDYSSEPTTLIEFVLEKTQDGVLLTVTESGFDQIPLERRTQAFEANTQGWTGVMSLIEKYTSKHV